VAIRFQQVHKLASSCKRSTKARSTRRSAACASQPRPTMHSEDTAKVINHRHGHCWRGSDRATHSRRHRGGRPGGDRDLSTSRDLLVLIGAPADGQEVLLAVKAMGGESAPRLGARWSRISSGRPEATRFLVVNRASDLEPVRDEYRSNAAPCTSRAETRTSRGVQGPLGVSSNGMSGRKCGERTRSCAVDAATTVRAPIRRKPKWRTILRRKSEEAIVATKARTTNLLERSV
jgi:hypothetical protein